MCPTHYKRMRKGMPLNAPIKKYAAPRVHLVEDVEWIIGTDSVENIARRVGCTDPADLYRALRYRGRDDLADRLKILSQAAA